VRDSGFVEQAKDLALLLRLERQRDEALHPPLRRVQRH
jgi:hypothetical protein